MIQMVDQQRVLTEPNTYWKKENGKRIERKREMFCIAQQNMMVIIMYNYNTAVAREFCGIIQTKSRTKRNKYHCCVFCFMSQSLGGCCVQEKTFTATQKCHFVYQYGVEAETKRPQSDCLPLFIRRKSETRFHRFCYDNIITAVQVVIVTTKQSQDTHGIMIPPFVWLSLLFSAETL